MDLVSWLTENDHLIDWQVFGEPWDAMQRRHNPFRDDQIGSILHLSINSQELRPCILDLGCGPGILGRRLLQRNPDAQYYGADGDPLMLAAMQRLLAGRSVHPLRVDLRSTGWVLDHQSRFDCVMSLTALHWLSKDHLHAFNRALWSVLKPGGRLLVGDPYFPSIESARPALKAFQAERSALEKGPTWEEFWTALFNRYPMKDVYAEYHRTVGYQEPFEGTDDGYPIAFHMESLTDAGFAMASVFWMSGLRIVYGGTKPAA
jgi:trans-aconitate methyltransferase